VDGNLQLHISLTKFARSCYPDKLAYVDQTFATCIGILDASGDASNFGPQIVALLSIPLEGSSNVLDILKLENFPALMNLMPNSKRKEVAARWCQSLISSNAALGTTQTVEGLYMFITPLIIDSEKEAKDNDSDDEDGEHEDEGVNSAELEQEQNLVARLVHLLRTDDLDTLFKLYSGTRKMFGKGGEKRIKYTFPPLVTQAVRLALNLKLAEDQPEASFSTSAKKVFQYCHQTCTALKEAKHSEIALRLFLETAQGSGSCGYPAVCYECMVQAFTIWEEDIHDSKAMVAALLQIIGTMCGLGPGSVSDDDYGGFTKTLVKACSKLMKKQDQCKTIYLSSHLFWREGQLKDDKKVLDCLKKALKIADAWSKESAASSTHLMLFVDILNQYIYFFDQGHTVMKKFIPSLMQLIDEHIKDAKGAHDPILLRHYSPSPFAFQRVACTNGAASICIHCAVLARQTRAAQRSFGTRTPVLRMPSSSMRPTQAKPWRLLRTLATTSRPRRPPTTRRLEH
jgi:vacuolar protein sorting-associated protein 35